MEDVEESGFAAHCLSMRSTGKTQSRADCRNLIPAEPLLIFASKDQTLEVEARVLNKDIRFACAGQSVAVKIEAFPFTRYGEIERAVKSVSNDAIADEKLGLYYPARVRVKASTMSVEGADVLLSPGMAVTAEVTTGMRRLIAFVLSPVMGQVKESGRERL